MKSEHNETGSSHEAQKPSFKIKLKVPFAQRHVTHDLSGRSLRAHTVPHCHHGLMSSGSGTTTFIDLGGGDFE